MISKKEKNISSKILKHSMTEEGQSIVSFELEYPRIVLAQVNTHRVFSKNTASSRAIPVPKMIDLIENNPVIPVYWGKNRSGMQADEELDSYSKLMAEKCWLDALNDTIIHVEELHELGAHKQITNRLLEPWQYVKTVLTATELQNFFNLRVDSDTQPELACLARLMKECLQESVPQQLKVGEWHLPYIELKDGKYFHDGKEFSLEDAIKISISCCAQVSYRAIDMSIEKADRIIGLLLNGKHIHGSPFEHQATPLLKKDIDNWKENIYTTHIDKKDNLWSANFKWWGQYRQKLTM